MTEATSSRLGAGFEITLISSERRSVPEMLGVAMAGAEGMHVWDCQRGAGPAMRNHADNAYLPVESAQSACCHGSNAFWAPPTPPAIMARSWRPRGSGA